jgi:hypothetical protein
MQESVATVVLTCRDPASTPDLGVRLRRLSVSVAADGRPVPPMRSRAPSGEPRVRPGITYRPAPSWRYYPAENLRGMGGEGEIEAPPLGGYLSSPPAAGTPDPGPEPTGCSPMRGSSRGPWQASDSAIRRLTAVSSGHTGEDRSPAGTSGSMCLIIVDPMPTRAPQVPGAIRHQPSLGSVLVRREPSQWRLDSPNDHGVRPCQPSQLWSRTRAPRVAVAIRGALGWCCAGLGDGTHVGPVG